MMPRGSRNNLSDILSNYEIVESGCWIWLGCTSKTTGYGLTSYEGKSHSAHVFFYEQHKGPVPKGKEVGHICNVEACVNPSHLIAMTHRENLAMARKFKLTDVEVEEIRARQDLPLKVVAELYGITPDYVAQLRTSSSTARRGA
jgi:hypothetical protein